MILVKIVLELNICETVAVSFEQLFEKLRHTKSLPKLLLDLNLSLR